MNEPLKDKWSINKRGYTAKDFESAVEWFIENLRDDVNKMGATILIKEAFEDVSAKHKNKSNV